MLVSKVTKQFFLVVCLMMLFSTLISCDRQANVSNNSYRCELTKLIVCDKEHKSCNPVSRVGVDGKAHATFNPESLSVKSFQGDKLLNKTSLSFWQVREDAIFMSGYGNNAKGDETVWAGSIDRKTGKLIVSAISVDYNFIVNGECQLK